MDAVVKLFSFVAPISFGQLVILLVLVPVVLTVCVILFIRFARVEKIAGAEFDQDGAPVPKRRRSKRV